MSSSGYSNLTLGGDGQYCIVISVAALSHCIEGIDREVIGSDRLQVGDSEDGSAGRKHVCVQETGGLIPAVSVNRMLMSGSCLNREGGLFSVQYTVLKLHLIRNLCHKPPLKPGIHSRVTELCVTSTWRNDEGGSGRSGKRKKAVEKANMLSIIYK